MISFTDLIKKVFQLYTNNLKIIFPLILVSLLWNIATALIPVSAATALRFMLPIILASFIISAFTELALINGFSALIQNTKVKTKTLLLQALAKLPRFVLIFILWSIIILIGIIFLIVPAIIFATWFMFIGAIIMLEKQPGIADVFRRSKYLVSNNFFPLLSRVATVMILTIIIIAMANQGFTNIINTFASAGTSTYLTMLTNLFGPILTVLLLPIVTGTIVVLYYEVRGVKGA